MQDGKNSTKPKGSQAFTVDSEFSGTVEVPSITRLLNRKVFKPRSTEEKRPTEPTKTITNLFKRPDPIRPSEAPSLPQPKIEPPSAESVPNDAPLSLEPNTHYIPQQQVVFDDHGSMVIDMENLKEKTRTPIAPTYAPPVYNTQKPAATTPPPIPAVAANVPAPAAGFAPTSSIVLETTAPEIEKTAEPARVSGPARTQAPAPRASAPTPAPARAPEPAPRAQTRQMTASGSTPSVQIAKAGLRARAGGAPLIIWDLGKLKRSSDPLGRGLAQLMESGARSALFLTIMSPPPGSPVPHFFGTAAVAPKARQAIWTGLKWDPTLIPQMWNQFVRAGQVEMSPPGTVTSNDSTRNVVRAAFGCSPTEWLTLVRVGPQNACRGVLALVSDGSIHSAIAAAQLLLAARPPVKSRSNRKVA